MSRHINSGYNGKFDRMGRKVRDSAQQSWELGQVVNVGFLKGLTVTEKHGNESILRSAKGVFYSFVPHEGIARLNGPSIS